MSPAECTLVILLPATYAPTPQSLTVPPQTKIRNIPVAFLQFSPLYFDVLFGQLAIEVQRDIEAAVASESYLTSIGSPDTKILRLGSRARALRLLVLRKG